MADVEFIRELRDGARAVLNDTCDSSARHRFVDEGAGIDRDLWRTAVALGWPMLVVPEPYGGLGMGMAEAAVLQCEIGRALAPIPSIGACVAARALSAWPDEAVREAFLPRVASGELVCAIASTDATATLVDRHGGDELLLSVEVDGVLDGWDADLYLLQAPTDAGPGLFLVERDAAVDVTRLPAADRTRTLANVSIDCKVTPAARCLLGNGAAMTIAGMSDDARILLASDAIGGAEAALEASIEYLNTRVQFGKPIGSFQALKHRVADHKVTIEAAARLVVRAQAASDAASERGLWAAMAKAKACAVFGAVAADMVQLHGGIGFTWEHDSHLYLKRALLDRFLFGDTADLEDLIAERLLARVA